MNKLREAIALVRGPGLADEVVDDIIQAVIDELPRGGQVPKDLREHRNSKVYSAIYSNGWSDHDKVIYQLLTDAKENKS
jgi:hypothetical protein